MEKTALPDYENPPVVETVLGVQFERLPRFKNAHLGAFWKSLGTDEWPTVSDAPPLQPQFERFTEPATWGMAAKQLRLSLDPLARLLMTNKDGSRMIQLQNGRLHFNWLGRGGDRYPRYSKVREEFIQVLEQFKDFVASAGAGEFSPDQWEVTYLNQIPKGTVWNTLEDWGFFRPLGSVPTLEGVVQGESFGGAWHFVIPEKRGRLHVEWQHGHQADKPEQEAIVLTLTARGPLPETGSTVQRILEGLDLGHETIVRSFAAFMDKGANEYWRLKNARD